MKPVPRLVIALLCAGLCRAAAQDGSVVVLSQSGQPSQNLVGTLKNFVKPVLSGSGRVIFVANSDGATGSVNQAVYVTDGTLLQTVATNLSAAPTIGGVFSGFSSLLLNEKGLLSFVGLNSSTPTPLAALYWGTAGSAASMTSVAATGQASQPVFSGLQEFAFSDAGMIVFRADTGTVANPGSGIFYTSPSGLITLANSTQTAPGIGGLFSSFLAPGINNVGGAVFQAASANGQQGIYASYGRTLVPVVTTLTPSVALNNAIFTSFLGNPVINDRGTAAFVGIAGTPVSHAPKGIFTGSGGSLTTIASTNQPAPGLGTNFEKFFDPSINNSGTVAFRGQNFDFTKTGIYTGNGGALQTITTSLQTTPHLTGTFSSFSDPALNNGGTVAFLKTTSTGKALYLSDGRETVTAAYTGQSVAGGVVSDVIFAGAKDRGGASQFNDNGQLAYLVSFSASQSALLLFTPTLHYRPALSGPDVWGNRANWTVSLQPASVHDVFIDPASSLTVTGPSTPVTVKNLTINGTGGATASLALQKTGALTVLEDLTVGANGVLAGSGKIIGDVISNGSFAAAAGASLTLSGEITGQSVSTTGPGTVNLKGAQHYAALNALAGTTNVESSFTGGTATVTANATLNFGASQTLAALNIGAGGLVTLNASSDSSLAAAPTVVPEPGTMALLASWSLLILWRVRRVRTTR